MNKLHQLCFAAIALALVACASVGPEHQGAPATRIAPSFTGSTNQSEVQDRWWIQLGDSRLNALVDQALNDNFDIRIAIERLVQSRATQRVTSSTFLPQLSANASYTHVNLSENAANFIGQNTGAPNVSNQIDLLSAGGDLSWEIDLFGGGRRRIEAARAAVDMTMEDVLAARLATIAEVIDAYYAVASQRRQLDLIEENIRLQTKVLKLIQQRADEGLSSPLEVQRGTTQLQTIRAAKPPIKSNLTTQLRRLALLTGQSPERLDSELETWADFPATLPMARTGLPSELLTRRPDLRRAERRLAATTAKIGVAESRLYPRFFLLGQPRVLSGGLANLFDPASLAWQFAPRMEWEIFTAGRNRALLKSANSQQQEALLRYEKQVLAAIAEVEIQIANLQAAHQRHARLSEATKSNQHSTHLANQLHQAGRINRINLLTEQQSLNRQTLHQTRAQSQLIQAWLRLHKALGGGWQ